MLDATVVEQQIPKPPEAKPSAPQQEVKKPIGPREAEMAQKIKHSTEGPNPDPDEALKEIAKGETTGQTKESTFSAIESSKLVEAAQHVLQQAESPTQSSWIGPDGTYFAGSAMHKKDAQQIIETAEPEWYKRDDVSDPILYVVENGFLAHVTNQGRKEFGIDLSHQMPEAGINAILDLGFYHPDASFTYTISKSDKTAIVGKGLENLRKDLAKARIAEIAGKGQEIAGENQERSKKPITKETKEWSSDLDTQLPINGGDLPNFKAWVGYNDFQFDRKTGGGHEGFDFAAYLTTDNKIVVGLPANTKIRAVADGEVRQVLDVFRGYGTQISVEHGAYDSGMFSTYIHVRPLVEQGVTVKKGDVIAELYKDEGDKEGRLVHLHLSLRSGWGTRGGDDSKLRAEDPALIDNSISQFKAESQGSSTFTVPQLPDAKIKFANFKRVRLASQGIASVAYGHSTQPVTKVA